LRPGKRRHAVAPVHHRNRTNQEIAMATRKLEKQDLAAYVDHVAKTLGTEDVRIEVASLDFGDQIEAEWVGLTNISDDPHNDVIDIGCDRLSHRIHNPHIVYVREGDDGLESIDVERADGVKEIIQLHQPLLLPAPAA
jgi:hypothetical protein